MPESVGNKKYRRTSDLARACGVHPNTVRRYVDLGLLPSVDRTPKGYRRFTQHHLDCLRVACLIYRSNYPGRGLRASAREVLTSAIANNWESALQRSIAHLSFIQAEQQRAEAAAAAIEQWQSSADMKSDTPGVLIGDTAKLLDVTLDMLRNWERNGLINVPRHHNGYRLYGWTEIQRLRVIRALTKAGYSQMAILRMLLQLDRGISSNVRQTLDTPLPGDDVYAASDRWLSTLAEQEQVAHQLIALIQEMLS